MNRTIEVVDGVRFDLAFEPSGKILVSRNGHACNGYLEKVGDKFKVSIIAGKSFKRIGEAIRHLVYWYTFDDYKKPLELGELAFPDGTILKASYAESDGSLDLTIWQIEIKVEEARHFFSKLVPLETSSSELDIGKRRVYRAEIGLQVHKALELMLKIALGAGPNAWRFEPRSFIHWLSILHDKIETIDPRITQRLDDVFQRTVMVHGDPRFGDFRNPTTNEIGDNLLVTIG